jgi:hypothetical protein
MNKIFASIVFKFIIAGFIYTNTYSQNTDCIMSVQFTTVTTGANFAPRHVLAVWIENSDGQFVRSLKVMADRRKQYLYTWQNKSSGNIVDAITGATLNSHGSESIVWNGKDFNQIIVVDGGYKVKIEFTEEHAQGPILEIPFTKNTSLSDSTLPDATYFTNISIDYSLVTSNITNEATTDNYNFNIFPNPAGNNATARIWSDKNTNAIISVYSINGQCLFSAGNIVLKNGLNFIELNKECITNLAKGTYLLRIDYDKEIKVTKLIKQ